VKEVDLMTLKKAIVNGLISGVIGGLVGSVVIYFILK